MKEKQVPERQVLTDTSKVTMTSLLKKAPLLLIGKMEVLLLLSTLYGIIAGVAMFGITRALQPIIANPDIDVVEAKAILETVGDRLPVTALIILLVNSALLLPFMRLLVDAVPFEGGWKKFFVRFGRIFALQITALALFLAFLITLSIIFGILSVILPSTALLVIVLTLAFAGMLTIFTVAHVAILGEAIDSRTSLILAWHMIRPLIMPIAAAYGAIKITSMLLSSFITMILAGLVATFDLIWLPSMIGEAIGFAAQILHLAACLWATQAIMNQRKNNRDQP